MQPRAARVSLSFVLLSMFSLAIPAAPTDSEERATGGDARWSEAYEDHPDSFGSFDGAEENDDFEMWNALTPDGKNFERLLGARQSASSFPIGQVRDQSP